jgi:hypothetical protein
LFLHGFTGDTEEPSFSLKAESEHLLETAKRAVEIAIETDEQTAMEYIGFEHDLTIA